MPFANDADRFIEFQIAEALGKTRAELVYGMSLPITTRETAEWVAYFRLKGQLETREYNKAKAKADMDRRMKGQ